MRVTKGKVEDIAQCISIAKSLPQYFTENAIRKIQKDLEDYLFYVILDSEEVVGFLVADLKGPQLGEIPMARS